MRCKSAVARLLAEVRCSRRIVRPARRIPTMAMRPLRRTTSRRTTVSAPFRSAGRDRLQISTSPSAATAGRSRLRSRTSSMARSAHSIRRATCARASERAFARRCSPNSIGRHFRNSKRDCRAASIPIAFARQVDPATTVDVSAYRTNLRDPIELAYPLGTPCPRGVAGSDVTGQVTDCVVIVGDKWFARVAMRSGYAQELPQNRSRLTAIRDELLSVARDDGRRGRK